MIVKTMLPFSKADECSKDKRVVVWREREGRGSRDHYGDHMFVCWGNHRDYDFSDSGAEDPFEPILDEDGEETGRHKPKKGMIIFPVNLYDHSGLHFSLGDPSGGSDPKGFDTTRNAAYLYIDKERFCRFQGEGRWMQVPVDADWNEWRPAKDFAEFRMLMLGVVAKQEVDEMNLIAEGQLYGYDVEEADPWVKSYTDGRLVHGCDWVSEPGTGGGGYLTEHADDIEFPRDPDLPVYYKSDVCLMPDWKRGLGSYEYTIPEFIVHAPTTGGNETFSFYAGQENGVARWTEDRQQAKVYYTLYEASEAAKAALGTDDKQLAQRACVEKDNWKTKKEKEHGTEENQG